jgi:hypothetical protein
MTLLLILSKTKRNKKKQKGSQEKYDITAMPNFYVQLSF